MKDVPTNTPATFSVSLTHLVRLPAAAGSCTYLPISSVSVRAYCLLRAAGARELGGLDGLAGAREVYAETGGRVRGVWKCTKHSFIHQKVSSLSQKKISNTYWEGLVCLRHYYTQ